MTCSGDGLLDRCIKGLHISASAITLCHCCQMDFLKISKSFQEGGRATHGTESNYPNRLSHHHPRLVDLPRCVPNICLFSYLTEVLTPLFFNEPSSYIYIQNHLILISKQSTLFEKLLPSNTVIILSWI